MDHIFLDARLAIRGCLITSVFPVLLGQLERLATDENMLVKESLVTNDACWE